MSRHMQSTYAMHGKLVVGRFLFFFPDSVFLFSGSEYSRLTLVCLLFWNLGGTHGNSMIMRYNEWDKIFRSPKDPQTIGISQKGAMCE